MGQIILRLDRVMADRKMSLNDLSEKVGVSNVNLSKMKNGNDEIIRTKIKSSGEECRLSCTVTYDNIDEPYCIIGRIISRDIENKAE